MIFVCSHGKDDPERAIIAFAAANTAAIAGIPTVVLCTIDGVWLGTPGGTDGFEKEGLPRPGAVPERSTTAARCGCAASARGRGGSPRISA